MKRLLGVLFLLSGCTSGNPGLQNDGGSNPQGSTDLAMGSSSGGQCPCAAGHYCDLASNTCKPGCAFDADCQSHHCDVSTHQCFTPAPPDLATRTVGDLGVMVSCQSASDCPGGVCCAHLTYGPSPSCTQSAVVRCDPSCPFQFPLSQCNAMGEAQVCQQKADCKDPSAANCCTFTVSGMSGSFCVSDPYKQFGTCLN